MVLKDGDFVRVNYTGKIKGSNIVFDTTSEKTAKDHGVFDPKISFKPSPIVVGSGHAIKGVDESLVGMEVGEKKVFDVPPEKAYGPRDSALVKLVPIKEFKRQGMNPVPGMRFEADGKVGRIQSVGGGRVRVDFNYELAGKTLDYEINVEEKVNKLEEKIRLLTEIHFPYADHNEHEITMSNGKVVIVLSESARVRKEAPVGKHLLSRDAMKFFDKVKAVEFRELFEREKKEKAKPAAKPKKKSKKQK